MKQLNVSDEMRIDIDFTDGSVPDSAQTFQPLLFKDRDMYCCVLGPDLQQGVVGRGKTPIEALKEWDKELKKRMKVIDKDDEVSLFIQRVINPSDESV